MDFNSFVKFYETASAWVSAHVFKIDTLIELGAISLALILSSFVTRYLRTRFQKSVEEKRRKKIKRFLPFSTRNTFFTIVFTLTLFLTASMSDFFSFDIYLQTTIVSLLFAWLAFHFISVMFEKSIWTKLIAFMVWVVAALNIVGLLGPAFSVLNSIEIPIGHNKITVLMILQGIFIFVILYWSVTYLSKLSEKKLRNLERFTATQKILMIKTLKIALITIALVIGLDFIGLNLTALAFFGGAVGFGIGFGLQKVFSNLISGFILLLDRSIKPGDVIAVADTYGVVQTLEARYVAVVTRDGKKHLIPNETLISERVENWSYQDNQIRTRIDIGISYGSDLEKAMRLLEQVALDHPRTLSSPAPLCIIREFGDYSINLQLRLWLDDPENGLGNPKSEVLLGIWKQFKKHKIEIPFPQSEIKVHSFPKGFLSRD